jgi:hypothetical protein
MAALLETKDSSAVHLAARISPGVLQTTEAIDVSLHGLNTAVGASCLQVQAGVLQQTRQRKRAASTEPGQQHVQYLMALQRCCLEQLPTRLA